MACWCAPLLVEVEISNPISEDYGSCAMRAKPYQDKKGEAVICSGIDSVPCPEDYTCRNLAFYGICCPRKTEELFEKNYNPRCAKGNLVTHNRGGWESTLLGRSCRDRFCPKNSKCQQQEIFAYCCQ